MTPHWVLAASVAAVLIGGAQTDAGRPPLFFREDWADSAPARPITQAHVANPDLRLGLYGPGADQLKKSHHEQPADDPFYLWSGDAAGPWAATLRHVRDRVDLRGLAKVRWRARQSGFRRLHLLVRLPDDTWAISEEAHGESSDWRVHDFAIQELHWRRFDRVRITEGPRFAPDLSQVIEVGFTDLMRGGGTPASSRLDWIEVYGRRVPASAALSAVRGANDRRGCSRPAAALHSGECTRP